MIEYYGYIRRTRFYSEQSSYIIASVEVEQEDNFITMVGYMKDINEYQKYRFVGEYVIHPKYGKQFSISSYEVVLATSKHELVIYLSSALFKGVGKVQAQQIVDQLGEDCLEQIIEDKNVLNHVKGMTELKKETIYEVLTRNKFDQEVIQFFMGYGVSLKTISKIQASYKDETLQIIQENPYRLIDDIDGINFKTADELALKIGFSLDDPKRIEAAIIASIKEITFQNGSTYVLLNEIEDHLYQLLYTISSQLFYECIDELVVHKKVVLEENRYYVKEMYDAECSIATHLQRIMEYPTIDYDETLITQQIKTMQEKEGIEYARLQIEAIHQFMQSPCMILTGGPGTGKTTIVRALLTLYTTIYPNEKIALLAPTGRAAKRLTELTGIKATTIHSLLRWDLHTNTFGKNEKNPIEDQVLLIDEASMVDTLLLSKLLQASRDVTKIIFIGDHFQLPSVSPGNVLHDLMQTNIPKVCLEEIFRQAQTSRIIQLSHQMVYDKVSSLELFHDANDMYFCPCTSSQVVHQTIHIVSTLMNQGFETSDIQILAPMYKGVAGIDRLNDALQEVMNPMHGNTKTYRVGSKVYREGDKILQLKNLPEEDVYNGDIGVLIEIILKGEQDYTEDTFLVDYDGNVVQYTAQTFPTITHAYCMSIHKAQGSEFKVVVVTTLQEHARMLKRNLLYTGITRAKTLLFVVGQEQAFYQAIANNEDPTRKTTLIDRFF